MESYQETVLSATKLSFYLIENKIGEFPVGANLLFFLVCYLESLLIAAQIESIKTWAQFTSHGRV